MHLFLNSDDCLASLLYLLPLIRKVLQPLGYLHRLLWLQLTHNLYGRNMVETFRFHWRNAVALVYWLWEETSVTWLGYFWKILAANFLTKVAQIFGNFFNNFQKLFEEKASVNTILATLGKIWPIFITTSGDTDDQEVISSNPGTKYFSFFIVVKLCCLKRPKRRPGLLKS